MFGLNFLISNKCTDFFVTGIHEGNVRPSRNSDAGAMFLDGGKRTRRQAGH